MNTLIPRHLTPDILESARFFPAIGLIGPRQSGKTTLAKNLVAFLGKPILFLDMELSSDVEKLIDPFTFLKYYQDYCVIIDEVQLMPALFSTLRPLIDDHRVPARFILLGSSSPVLIRHSSETLAGRIAYHELAPFSLLEISDNVKLFDHWLYGGFPEVLLTPNEPFRIRWVDNFIRTFIERDLMELGHEVRVPNMNRLWQMMAHVHGNVLNVNDISKSLGIGSKTINHYLDLLEGGFMIHRLPSYFTNIGKRLVKSPKFYIRDSGILHHLLRLRDFNGLMGHPAVGNSWEGYVIEQIRRVTKGTWELYYYRTHAGAECDLYAIKPNGKTVCIEIKLSSTATVTKGFWNAVEDLKPDEVWIVVPEGDAWPKTEKVWVAGLKVFLERI